VKNNIVPISVYRFSARYTYINSASENRITMWYNSVQHMLRST